MYSLAWPNMFTSAETKLVADKEAIKSNLKLLFNAEKMELFGDPYFGSFFKPFYFQPNNNIIADLLVDEIYSLIIDYMPQLYVDRKDIKVRRNKIDLIVEMKVTYRENNTSDLYVINLTNNEQEG